MWESLMSLFQQAAPATGEAGNLMQSPAPMSMQQPSMASQMGMPADNIMQSMDPNLAPTLGQDSLMATTSGGDTGSSKGKKYQNDMVDMYVQQGLMAPNMSQPQMMDFNSLMNMIGGRS